MSFTCERAFTITINPPIGVLDMGLDAAIFNPTTGKIFGVRGQWLFQFNAVTAALEKSGRFCDSAAGLSCLTSIGGTLYITTSHNPNADYSTATFTNTGDVYIVNAAAFTVTGQFSMTSVIKGGGGRNSIGFDCIATNGVRLMFGQINGDLNPVTQSATSVDPMNIPGFAQAHFGGWFGQIAFDSTQNLFWASDSMDPDIYAYATDASGVNWDSGLTKVPMGICWNLAQNKVYAVTGSRYLLEANAATALPLSSSPVIPVTQVDTTRATAKPARIQSVNSLPLNPYNGKVLIPAWADDTVLVWNPATDAVGDMVVKTGFTAPFDVVNTPIKSFAVQTGPIGLREII